MMNQMIHGVVGVIGGRVYIHAASGGDESILAVGEDVEFRVLALMPRTEQSPSWADVQLGSWSEPGQPRLVVRINPDLINATLYRFADCLWFAHKNWWRLRKLGQGQQMKSTFGGAVAPEEFVFSLKVLKAEWGEQVVVFADRYARMIEYCERR